MSCGTGPFRHRRHDVLARIIARAAISVLRADSADTTQRLSSSATSGRKVDVVITKYDHSHPVTSIDTTVSVPLLPSHIGDACESADILFAKRAREKDEKHLPGCVNMGRAFIAVVFTTLGGIGPAAAREYLDSFFAAAFAAERREGGTGSTSCLLYTSPSPRD